MGILLREQLPTLVQKSPGWISQITNGMVTPLPPGTHWQGMAQEVACRDTGDFIISHWRAARHATYCSSFLDGTQPFAEIDSG